MKKLVGKADRKRKKKKDKTVRIFPLREILSGKRIKIWGEYIATFSKRRYMFLQNVAICSHKIFWTIRWVVGTFPPSEILRGKTTNFGETYSDVFKTSLYVSPKFSGLDARCSLITIATFLENVAINKKPIKIVLFATF